MSTLSGWCMDALQALDLDQPAASERLHEACPRPGCGCTCHTHQQPEETP